jgi:hypothetical protein
MGWARGNGQETFKDFEVSFIISPFANNSAEHCANCPGLSTFGNMAK